MENTHEYSCDMLTWFACDCEEGEAYKELGYVVRKRYIPEKEVETNQAEHIEHEIILNKRQLADLLSWVNTLDLKAETYNDVIQAIDKANKRIQ